MRIGIPKEIKAQEYRVGATPDCVAAFVGDGHDVRVQQGAGLGAGFTDHDFEAAGAHMGDAADAWAADLVIKVKEPLAAEYAHFREGQLLLTYLHLAAVPELATALMRAGVSALAYETIEREDGSLPCLTPMSMVAGRLSVQQGAKYLERPFGGRGVLLGGVPGVPRGRVTIVGGGTVGTEAAKVAVGMGARVTLLDISPDRLAHLDELFDGRLQTLYSTPANLATTLADTDLVIGAVLLPGGRAPKLITREHLATMPEGAVLVDVAVDQGGCAETTRPTTHHDPVFEVDGVQHYCVTNMPSAVSRTATQALTSVTLPYARKLASEGLLQSIAADRALRLGLNVHEGHVVHAAVASALGLPRRSIAA